MESGIYKITNIVNGKLYVGSACNWYISEVKKKVAHNERLDINDRDLIRDYLENSLSTREISKKYGLSAFGVTVRLRRNNVEIRSNDAQKRLERSMNYDYSKIAESYISGMSYKKVGALFGRGAMTIRDIVIEIGLPIRTMKDYHATRRLVPLNGVHLQ